MTFWDVSMEKLSKIVLMSKKESWDLHYMTDEDIENQLKAGEGMAWTLWPWTMVFRPSSWFLDLILCFCILLFCSFGKQLLLTLCSQPLLLVLFPRTQGIKCQKKFIKLIPLKYLFSIRWDPVKCNLLCNIFSWPLFIQKFCSLGTSSLLWVTM